MRRVFLSTSTDMLCPHLCSSHDEIGGFLHCCAHLEIKARILQNLPALFNVCALKPQHNRHLHVQLARRCDNARCQPVHAENAAEDIDEDGLHIRVGEEDFKRMLDLFLGCAAAYIKEVG